MTANYMVIYNSGMVEYLKADSVKDIYKYLDIKKCNKGITGVVYLKEMRVNTMLKSWL